MKRIIKSAEEKANRCEPFERNALEMYASSFEGANPCFDPAALVAEARAHAERILQEAREQGLRAGMEAGIEQVRESMAQAQQALHSAAEAIQQARAEFLATLEPEVLRLVEFIAGRVLHREAQGDLEVVRSTIRAALQHVVDRDHTAVHLNPEDLASLQEQGIDIAKEFAKFERLELVPDDTVGRGGCTVETQAMSVDARLDTQLQRILEALTDQPS